MSRKVIFLILLLGFLAYAGPAWAATELSNLGEANDMGTGIFRSNIWRAFRFTAGAGATIDSVTIDLDEDYSNYSSGTQNGGVIRFYEDDSETVGDQVSGTITYTSTDTDTGYTVYGEGDVTLPSAGDYWLALTCASCANVQYEETGSTSYTGESGWATVLADNAISTSNNDGSTWGTPYSSETYGTIMIEIASTDTTNPSVSTLSPADDGEDVPVDASLVMTFDEAVDAESGNIDFYQSDGTLVEEIDVTSGQVTGSGTTEITINPTADLTKGLSYYVQIDASAFDDAAGNSYAGISDSTTWSFSAIPVPPTPVPSSGGGGRQGSGLSFFGNDESGEKVTLKSSTSSGSAETSAKGTSLSSSIPDADQVQEVYVRVDGKKILLEGDGSTYETKLDSVLSPGRYPYTLTADYGVTTLSHKGEVIVTKPGTEMKTLVEEQDNLFKRVFEREAKEEEENYWIDRVLKSDKETLPELLGAMQWQYRYGGIFSGGTVRAVVGIGG